MMKRNLLFVAVLLFVSSAFAQKLAPNALLLLSNREAVKEHSLQKSPSQEATETETAKVFIEIASSSAIEKIEAQGGKILSVISDNFVTALLPLDILRAVAELEDVKFVQVASEVRPLMDIARGSNEARVDLAHRDTVDVETGTYSGKGIVFGLVDTGLEYGHLAFYDKDGQHRLKRVWLQTSTVGKAPAEFGYGSEYTTESEMLSAVTDNSSQYHATHVAGIAAGSDFTSKYYGVAPEVDIVMVSYNPSSGSDVDVVNGVKYIFNYADSVGKPCVVNLSLGSHTGPHDGTSLIDRAFDEMTGPGRIIVGAAGNEAIYNLHASKKLTADDTKLKTMIGYESSSSSARKQALLDIWGTENSTMTIKGVVVDAQTGKLIKGTKELSSATNSGETDQLDVSVSQTGVAGNIIVTITVDPNNNRPHATLQSTVDDLADNRRIGVILTGEEGDEIHIWNCTYGSFLTPATPSIMDQSWVEGDNLYTVGEIGGTAKSIISAGSYNSRTFYTTIANNRYTLSESVAGKTKDWSLFSSIGPTLDGRTKPDVSAPGIIVAAFSRNYVESAGYANDVAQVTTDANGKKYYYDISFGTSMASPFVAGSVALWLQANPNLTPKNIKEIIRRSSRTDKYTGSVPNNKWGYGKIDTYAGLLEAATLSSLEEVEAAMSLLKVIPDPYTHTLQFFFADGDGTCGLNVAVYDTMGRYVANYRIDANGQTVDASALKRGLYVLQIECNGVVRSEKVIL